MDTELHTILKFIVEQNDKCLKDIDGLQDKTSVILTTQSVHTQQLKEHMRRTELAEENIEQLRSSLVPVRQDLITAKTMVKLLAGIIGLAGTIIAILEALK